jgi:hypothetical protein
MNAPANAVTHLANMRASIYSAGLRLLDGGELEKDRDTLKTLAVELIHELKRLTEATGGDGSYWNVVEEAAVEAANEAFYAAIEERDEAAEASRDPVERSLSKADFLYDEARN